MTVLGHSYGLSYGLSAGQLKNEQKNKTYPPLPMSRSSSFFLRDFLVLLLERVLVNPYDLSSGICHLLSLSAVIDFGFRLNNPYANVVFHSRLLTL